MDIRNNVLKEYLKNVYFVMGTPCGGKTSVTRALSRMYGVPVYDIDERFDSHREKSSPEFQPAMNRQFADADEFFSRSVEEYKGWLLQNTREQLDFVLMDLIRLSGNGRIICDCHLTPGLARELTDPSRAAFLLRWPEELVDDYCNRPDHRGFSDFIHSAADFERAKATCNETLFSLNAGFYEEVKRSEFFWLERDDRRTKEETAALVAKYWGWDEKNAVRVEKVEPGTERAAELLRFVENFSWTDVKEHMSAQIRDWRFEDWEAVFAAVADGKIEGMTTAMKTDYYPLPEVFPWVSSVFVSEEYRGRRISGMMIGKANEYLKSVGFDRSYIPSEHVGLYEKYGYRYVKEIVNYGGGMDRLYVKELK